MIDAHELGNIDIIRRLIKEAINYVNVSNITSYISTITGGVAIRGSGTYVQSTGTIQFVNSNGLIFGLSNSGASGTLATNNTIHLYPFQGIYSTTTNGFPNSVGPSNIYGGGSQNALDYYAIIKEI